MTTAHKPRKRLRPGDLFEIRSDGGVALIHYIGRHETQGHTVYVYPKWYESRAEALRDKKPATGYVTFYPAQSAVLQGLAEIIDTRPLPTGASLPTRYRRPGAPGRNGKTLAWIIVEPDGREVLKRKLTAKERKLPIAATWSHAGLIACITDGYRPELEA